MLLSPSGWSSFRPLGILRLKDGVTLTALAFMNRTFLMRCQALKCALLAVERWADVTGAAIAYRLGALHISPTIPQC